jgi:hypothetical protein
VQIVAPSKGLGRRAFAERRFILVSALVVGAMTLLCVCAPYALVALWDHYQAESFRTDLAALLALHSPAVSLNDCELFDDAPLFTPAGSCLARANAAQLAALETGLDLTRRARTSVDPREPHGCIARPGFGDPGVEVLFGDNEPNGSFAAPLMVFVDRARGNVCFEARYGFL